MKTKFSVTQFGEKLSNSLYTWDEKTKTFSTKEDNLVLDFSGVDNVKFDMETSCSCTFISGCGCVFNTGSECMFNTGWDCSFTPGHNCAVYCSFFYIREVMVIHKLPSNLLSIVLPDGSLDN